ncbi:MAG: copper oxidase [Mesorhizobium sp.]|uniref:cupredoxin domain-containing protein n=2 Tax=Mesorhizobium TaxID=68287 RepID=UPI000FCB98EC|nr:MULTISPECIES: cupredoxin family protein [unclassified Mesorhizobium]RUV68782.1 copper oxidase [Mesorhizobium sp. M5C.F.Cr.IN.023.01.1.1]RWF87374.1 MAG: copper oxidase [Mesorhizobium sp.]RWF91722.1 MAG: copper oxidase [Mesorhizobium sp.]RWI33745.1 MAG: copper oxidase [Mesorhizobium sp.]RWI44762.1 MAG: copper oxidase [Mesorhizobium sp.]
MKHIIAAAVLMAVSSGAALAGGTHAGGHGDKAATMAIGSPGEAGKAKRTVNISMSETDDGTMLFQPAVLKVKQGETVRLKFVNKGQVDHEFVMDVHEGIMEHKALMEKFPEMEHADPNSIRLAPGDRGEIVWTFANAGEFGFACLIPGHYDSGMKGDITVAH